MLESPQWRVIKPAEFVIVHSCPSLWSERTALRAKFHKRSKGHWGLPPYPRETSRARLIHLQRGDGCVGLAPHTHLCGQSNLWEDWTTALLAKHLCMYLSRKETEHPNCGIPWQPGWAKPNLGVRNSIQVAGGRKLSHLSPQHCLPRSVLTGSWNQVYSSCVKPRHSGLDLDIFNVRPGPSSS